MKIVLVGVGGMGNVHFNIYKGMMDEIEFAAVCDIRLERIKDIVGDLPIKLYTDIDEMLAAEKPDYVDICTPTYLHVEQAIKAMESTRKSSMTLPTRLATSSATAFRSPS
jgi:predicted dehydrogenase